MLQYERMFVPKQKSYAISSFGFSVYIIVSSVNNDSFVSFVPFNSVVWLVFLLNIYLGVGLVGQM